MTAATDDNMIVINCTGSIILPAKIDFSVLGSSIALRPGCAANIAVLRIAEQKDTPYGAILFGRSHLDILIMEGAIHIWDGYAQDNCQHDTETNEPSNKEIILQAFNDWQQGHGNFFDLLSENITWTIVGSSPVSGTYHSKEELIEHSVKPINARLATSITPYVRHISAEGDSVTVFWEGSATTHDGNHYDNTYAWHMFMENGEIKEVTAFLDTWQLTELLE